MREIKFRLRIGDEIVGYEEWNSTMGCWMYFAIGKKGARIPKPYLHHTDKDQFTGLCDKKGGVYEKDIVKYSISKTQHFRGVVRWSQESYGFVIDYFWEKQDEYGNPDGDFYAPGFEANYHGTHRLDAAVDLVILGNVFQNKDLLCQYNSQIPDHHYVTSPFQKGLPFPLFGGLNYGKERKDFVFA